MSVHLAASLPAPTSVTRYTDSLYIVHVSTIKPYLSWRDGCGSGGEKEHMLSLCCVVS